MKPIPGKIILITWLIAITVNLSNCSKKNSDSPSSQDLGFFSLGEAKDYLLFKPGTWWVYKNSNTNELDTMVLFSSGFDTIHVVNRLPPSQPYKNIFSYEYITYKIYSHRDKAVYHTFCRGMEPDAAFFLNFEFRCQRDSGFYNKYHTGYGLSTQFYFPFHLDGHDGLSGTKFIERADSMDVRGKTYYDIVSFSVQNDGSYPYPNFYIVQNGKSIYHWAKYIGVIKIEHHSYDKNFQEIKMNWEIIESHILR